MNKKANVLIVDDEEVVRRSHLRSLASAGCNAQAAGDGKEALKVMEQHPFDVILLDLRMPGLDGMDGLEVAERIKARCPWTPVVVITGYGTEENEARASVLGVSGFVHKPLTPEIIENITLKALTEPEKAEVAVEPEAETEAEVKAVQEDSVLKKTGVFAKNVGLFFAAPFIALAYIIALPFVGFYMFAKLSYEAWTKRHPSA